VPQARVSKYAPMLLLHRAVMRLIGLIGSHRLFHLYRQLLIKVGPEHTAISHFGGVFRCDLRDRVPAFLFCFRTWEPDITEVISKRLRIGDLFVDVGANIGYYTVLAAQRVGANGKVIAIDASPSIFEKLKHTMTLNNCGNVRLVNMAVAAEAGTVTVYAGPPGNSGSTSILPNWRGGAAEAEIACRPLTDILAPDELARVRLIKIDVEGAEPLILNHLIDTLGAYPDDVEILVECTASAGDSGDWKRIFDRLIQKGFSAYAIDNSYAVDWYLRWRRPAPPRLISMLPPGQTDVLFTRADEFQPRLPRT
jgi:FkbM family methyltransferase